MLNMENKYEEWLLKSYCGFLLDKEDKIVMVWILDSYTESWIPRVTNG